MLCDMLVNLLASTTFQHIAAFVHQFDSCCAVLHGSESAGERPIAAIIPQHVLFVLLFCIINVIYLIFIVVLVKWWI